MEDFDARDYFAERTPERSARIHQLPFESHRSADWIGFNRTRAHANHHCARLDAGGMDKGIIKSNFQRPKFKVERPTSRIALWTLNVGRWTFGSVRMS